MDENKLQKAVEEFINKVVGCHTEWGLDVEGTKANMRVLCDSKYAKTTWTIKVGDLQDLIRVALMREKEPATCASSS